MARLRSILLFLFFLVLAHLLREAALVAKFLDLVHLGFKEVDVLFFVLEQGHQQVAGAVIAFAGGDGDGAQLSLA